MVSNPNFYGQSTTGTPNQIEDGVDFPHTGIIKALSLGMKQNYVINGFDITASSATAGTVSTGTIMRDGEVISVNSGSPPYAISLDTTFTNGYHLLVVDSSNAVVVRNPNSPTIGADKVPAYVDGDVIIAVLTHTGVNPFSIQYLTVNKTKNSLSVAYEHSNSYTEVSAITGTSDGLFISGIGTATVAGADKVLIQDSGSSDVIKSVTASSIAALAPQGDITSVVAGSALTGGGTTGDVTLNVGVDDSTIEINSDALRVKDDGITYAKIQDVSQTNVVLGRDTAGAGVIEEIGATALGTMIGDTLDTVTGRGGTTANNITVGAASITTRLFASKAGSLDANPDTIVQYVDASQNTSANQYTLPAASSYDGAVFIIKNLNPSANMAVVPAGSDVFEDNAASIDARYTSTTQLTLKPLQSVMLQAVTDSIVIPLVPTPNSLATGWMILETDTGGSSGIANVVDDTTPQLGGDLDVNSNKITGSIVFDGDVNIEAGHTLRATTLPVVDINSDPNPLVLDTHAGRYLLCSSNVTLPATSTQGDQYYLLNDSGSSISILRNGNTINGATSDVTLTSYKGATCIAIGSNNWIVLGV